MSEEQRKKATAYKNRYNSANYDSLRIVVPKGRKEDIEAHAKENRKSVNGLVNDLIREDMGWTDAEWKAGDPNG